MSRELGSYMEITSALSVAALLLSAWIKIRLLWYAQKRSRLPIPLHFSVLASIIHDLFLSYFVLGLASAWSQALFFVEASLAIRGVALVLVIVYLVSLHQLRFASQILAVYALIGIALVVAILSIENTAWLPGSFFAFDSLRSVSHDAFFRLYFLLGLGIVAATFWSGSKSIKLAMRQKSRATLCALIPLLLVYVPYSVMVFAGIMSRFDVLVEGVLSLVAGSAFIFLVLQESDQLASLRIKWGVLFRLARYRGDVDAASLTACVERAMVASAMRWSEHNKTESALLLGLSKSTFHRKADKYLGKANKELGDDASSL